MPDSKSAWEQVHESFSGLGRRLKEHYDQHAGDDDPETGDRKAVEDALRSLADAVDGVVTSVGSAVRDPGFRDDARRAAKTLADALSATFEEVSDDLKERLKPKRP